MFYLYYFDNIKREKDKILDKLGLEVERLKKFIEYDTTFFMDTWVANEGIYPLAKSISTQGHDEPIYMVLNALLGKYEYSLWKERSFRKFVIVLVILNFIILVISLNSLLNVDYSYAKNEELKNYAIVLGFICCSYFGFILYLMLRIILKKR